MNSEKINDGLVVPEKCRECPFITRQSAHIAEHETERDAVMHFAFDDEGNIETAQAIINTLGDDLDLTEQDIVDGAREGLGVVHAAIGEHIEEIRHETRHYARDCLGPWVLSRANGYREFKATVCASPRLPNGESSEIATVTRERL